MPPCWKSTEQNVNMARQRLRFWDVTDQQIDELAQTGKVRKSLTFYSPFDGIVVEKHAFEGKFLPAGQLLYRVADLSKVWAYVFVYQNQIHCVYEGQGATLRLANLPGHTFQGKVVYIYPYLDPKNRAVKVRLEFDNPDLVLKPGMFADILLEPHKMGTGIKIPHTAILQTGERSLVYLSEPGNKFQAQEVTTGMELDGGMTAVLTGLKEGQQHRRGPQFPHGQRKSPSRRQPPLRPGTELDGADAADANARDEMPECKCRGWNMKSHEGDETRTVDAGMA